MQQPSMQTSPMFDPASYAEVRKPLLEARTLPAWCYTSAEWHAREVERVFLKSWLFMGRVEQVPKPGDYLAIDTPGGPVLMIRGRDHAVRVFANTCRHRGAQLLEGEGNCRAIQCPYHSWIYATDGTLTGAPGMGETIGFDKADWSLTAPRQEIWEGCVFINFADEGPGLLDYFGDMTSVLGQYDFANLVCIDTRDYDVECNWKLLIENALEPYHTATVHKSTLGGQGGHIVETRGNWDAMFGTNDQDQSFSVLPGETCDLPFIEGLGEMEQRGAYFTVLYPATQFACAQDSVWWLRLFPTGPESCRLNVGFMFPRSAIGRPDFAEESKKHFERWFAGIDEDNWISVMQQKGLRSAARKPGPMSSQEPVVHKVYNWLLDRVVGNGTV
jgi:choline monooxygenase